MVASPARDPHLPLAREEGARQIAPLGADCEFMDVPSVDALNAVIFGRGRDGGGDDNYGDQVSV